MNIYEKLTLVQSQLRAPKGQFNKFGNFHYRSLEDIVEFLKPLLLKKGLTLIMSDSVKMIGDRFYIETTATLINSEQPEEKIITTALAREANEKKGMDSSQITGAASSYARKYCLNGLFAIDDNRDNDSPNLHQLSVSQTTKTAKYNGNNGSSNDNNIKVQPQMEQMQIQGLSKLQLEWLQSFCNRKNYTDDDKKEMMKFYRFSPKSTTESEFEQIKKSIESDDKANIKINIKQGA
jgi:hypothetical protein